MSVYLVAQINIHDRERYAEYGDGFMDIFKLHNGKLLAVDEDSDVLEGHWGFTRTVLLEFPSEVDANSWYHSVEYQQLAKHRFASSDANIVLLKGLA